MRRAMGGQGKCVLAWCGALLAVGRAAPLLDNVHRRLALALLLALVPATILLGRALHQRGLMRRCCRSRRRLLLGDLVAGLAVHQQAKRHSAGTRS